MRSGYLCPDYEISQTSATSNQHTLNASEVPPEFLSAQGSCSDKVSIFFGGASSHLKRYDSENFIIFMIFL